MEHITEQFTLVDFLGILMPGAIVTLAINTYAWDLTLPAVKFFGRNSLVMAVYFVGTSYFVGHILHQLSLLMEKYIWKVPNMHKKYMTRPEILQAYRKRFSLEASPDNSPEAESDTTNSEKTVSEEDEWEMVKAGQNIFHYVQRKERPQRIVLFTAFYTMSRAMVVAFALLFGFALWSGRTELLKALPLLTVYTLLIALFRSRWLNFEEKCLDEAYMLFLTEEPEHERELAT